MDNTEDPKDPEDKVKSLLQFRAAKQQAASDKQSASEKVALEILDQASRDVHHAASSAMKMVFLARQALGLAQLPRP